MLIHTYIIKAGCTDLDDLGDQRPAAGGVHGEQKEGQQEEEGQRCHAQDKVVPNA